MIYYIKSLTMIDMLHIIIRNNVGVNGLPVLTNFIMLTSRWPIYSDAIWCHISGSPLVLETICILLGVKSMPLTIINLWPIGSSAQSPAKIGSKLNTCFQGKALKCHLQNRGHFLPAFTYQTLLLKHNSSAEMLKVSKVLSRRRQKSFMVNIYL